MTDEPTDRPAAEHRRPPGLDDTTVEALGKISEALEAVERGRGHLYSFHQLTGTADETLQEGVRLLREAGHVELAEEIDADLVGRNVLPAGGPSRSSRSTTTATGRSSGRTSGRPGRCSPAAGGTSTRPR